MYHRAIRKVKLFVGVISHIAGNLLNCAQNRSPHIQGPVEDGLPVILTPSKQKLINGSQMKHSICMPVKKIAV